jgi:hypothetical protein
MARLKKLEESEFYDIRVPTTIDISELNNATFFPSLIETRSMPPPEPSYSPKTDKKKDKKQAPKITEGDFP